MSYRYTMSYRYYYRVLHLNGLGEVEDQLEWYANLRLTRRQYKERVQDFCHYEAHNGRYAKSIVFMSIGDFHYDEHGYMRKEDTESAEMHRVIDYTATNETGWDGDVVYKLTERFSFRMGEHGFTGYKYTFYADEQKG